MMHGSDISWQRCFNHPGREAVATCLECGRFFCRECVTEHDDRVVCAACLRRHATAAARTQASLRRLLPAVPCLAGILCAWLVFYGLGRALLRIPSSFHEGGLWREPAARGAQ